MSARIRRLSLRVPRGCQLKAVHRLQFCVGRQMVIILAVRADVPNALLAEPDLTLRAVAVGDSDRNNVHLGPYVTHLGLYLLLVALVADYIPGPAANRCADQRRFGAAAGQLADTGAGRGADEGARLSVALTPGKKRQCYANQKRYRNCY